MRFITKQINKVKEKLTSFPLDAQVPTERLGSPYGGWVIPKELLNKGSICYFAGAGTDVSFDLEVAQRYQCPVFIFDPTPKAIAHFEATKKGILQGAEMFTQGNKHPYIADPSVFEHIRFLEYGVWNKNEVLKFYVPSNDAYVSHSIKNLNKTSRFFNATVKSLSTIMNELGHDHIDLLKIDIEGAEYEVLMDIVEQKIPVHAICVEFDENFMKNMDNHYLQRIKNSIEALQKVGFKLIYREQPFDMTFIHERKL